MAKTNAIRLLESAGVPFQVYQYEMGEYTDAIHSAQRLGADPGQVFKTLVTVGASGEHFVFVIPGNGTLNLKKAAMACGQKNVLMIHQKELLPLTGYVHGGCSPIGMKKAFSTYIDETAILYERIFVSGGAIGTTLEISPEALRQFTKSVFVDVCD